MRSKGSVRSRLPYDAFMGRYSRRLAPVFADFCGLQHGQSLLDVGCGPGAFTGVAIERLGIDAVSAADSAPGGTVAAAVWDFSYGMEMLRAFWEAALTLWPDAPDEARTMRFGRERELFDLLGSAGLIDVVETTLTVSFEYESFDELWSSILTGIGPAGAYLVAKSPEDRAALRELMYERVGRPSQPFTLTAVARAARGATPA